MSSQDDIDAEFDNLEEDLPVDDGQQASPGHELEDAQDAEPEAPSTEPAADKVELETVEGTDDAADEEQSDGAAPTAAGKAHSETPTLPPDEDAPAATAKQAKPTFKGRRLEVKKPAAAATSKETASKPVKPSSGSVNDDGDKETPDDDKETEVKLKSASEVPVKSGDGKKAPATAKPKLPTFKAKAATASGPPDPARFKAKKKGDGAVSKKAGTDKTEKKEKKPRAKTAWNFFCTENRKTITEEEGLSFAEVSTRLGELWKAMSDDEKAPYASSAAVDQERVAELVAGGGESEGASTSKPASKPAKPAKPAKAVKRKAETEDASDEEGGDQKAEADEAAKQAAAKKRKSDRRSRESRKRKRSAVKGDEEEGGEAADEDDEGSEYDWEKDHEEVDWAAHPAECILAVTTQGKYVVKRRGLPLHDFGLVAAAAARREAAAGGGGDAAAPVVPAALINEFEGARKRFEKETTAHTLSRELDLDDLEEGTMLEACAFLGDLRREGLLDRKGLKQWSFADDKMSVPVMTTSFVIQRLLASERLEKATLQRENAQLQKQLDHAVACMGKDAHYTPLPETEE